MLTTALLLGGTLAFVGIAWGMYRTRRGTRAALAVAALVLLVALVWTGMALIEPGRV
ncbi:hypothetical protein QWY84_13605 [Aquisalimonas lutea]|uniref:hypothetical protein n=1 Tax=Aquisalimonas lutea TaxID=1327750 RepID=UPI0025B5BB04|nr:hypothetical protein [Aquisalimonas lutea]MDN3518651.1 hypothetical protein [Aquisalimonas lutea]